jgi:hypothetical protein
MADSVKVQSTAGKFELTPPGLHKGVCIDLIDLGEKVYNYPDGEKKLRKFMFVFELATKKKDGSPFFLFSRPFTPSYHEKSSLLPFIQDWLGRELEDEEKQKDLASYVGKPCELFIKHVKSGDKTYANIGSIVPCIKDPIKATGAWKRPAMYSKQQDDAPF